MDNEVRVELVGYVAGTHVVLVSEEGAEAASSELGAGEAEAVCDLLVSYMNITGGDVCARVTGGEATELEVLTAVVETLARRWDALVTPAGVRVALERGWVSVEAW